MCLTGDILLPYKRCPNKRWPKNGKFRNSILECFSSTQMKNWLYHINLGNFLGRRRWPQVLWSTKSAVDLRFVGGIERRLALSRKHEQVKVRLELWIYMPSNAVAVASVLYQLLYQVARKENCSLHSRIDYSRTTKGDLIIQHYLCRWSSVPQSFKATALSHFVLFSLLCAQCHQR